MTQIRKHFNGAVWMEALFFDELISDPRNPNEHARLTMDFECHALWHYYALACKNYRDAQTNLVEESERSKKFTPEDARVLFCAVANIHGVTPEKMARFWPLIKRQMKALGGEEILPDQFRFQYWGH